MRPARLLSPSRSAQNLLEVRPAPILKEITLSPFLRFTLTANFGYCAPICVTKTSSPFTQIRARQSTPNFSTASPAVLRFTVAIA